MSDKNKTKEQLIKELSELRKRVTELEKSESERNNVDEDQKKTEEQHRIFAESLFDGYLSVDLKGKIIDCNSAFLNHTGYSREDIVNKHFTKLPTVHLKDIPQYIKMYNSARRGKLPKSIEYQGIHKDGTTRWSETYFRITRKKCRISGFNIITRDITERKKTEEALKKSEKEFRDIFNNATDAIYIQNKEGRFLDVNQGAVNMYGYPKEFFIGKTPGFLSAPGKNDMKKIFGFVEDAFNGKFRQYDFWGIRKSGEVFPKIVRSQKGIYMGKEVVITFALDITERKQAEKVIRIQAEVTRNMAEGTYIVGLHDVIIRWASPRFEDMFGYEPGEMIGRHASIVNAPSDLSPIERANEIMEVIYRTGEWHGEINNIKKDGTLFWCHASVSVFTHFEYGEVLLAVHTDITERKKAEKEITKKQYYLAKAQEIGSIGTWELDLLKNELIWTDQNYRNFGIPIGTPLTYEVFLNCIHPADKDYVDTEWMAALTGKPYDIEHRLIIDEQVRWVKEKAEVDFDKDGKALKAIGFTQDITERRLAEQERKISEEKYRSLVESSEDPIYLVNKECEYLFMNNKNLSRLGIPLDQLIGKKYSHFHSKENTEIFRKKIAKVVKTGESQIYEHQSERDGRSFFRTLSPVKDERGKIVSVTVISKDITEQKKAEKKISETAELLRSTLESTDNGILVVDNDGKVIASNEVFAKLWKIPEEILATRNDNKLLNFVLDQLSVPKQFLDNVKDLYNKPEAESFDTLYFKDGRIFERYSQPLLIKGQAEGRVWSFRNVTERKQAEEILKESQEKLKLSMKSAREGMWEWDFTTDEVYFDDVCMQMFGYKPGEIQKTSEWWWTQWHPDDVAPTKKAVKEYLEGRAEKYFVEFRIKNKSGKYVWISSNGIVLRKDKNNKPLYMIGIHQDISERKKAEEEIKKNNILLKGILENTHMMAVYLDAKLNFLFVNKAYADTCKHPQDFFPGKNHFDLYPGKEVETIFQNVVDTGKRVYIEARPFKFPDQPERGITYWDWSLIPIKDSKKKVTGLVFTLAEVTERIRAEKTLKKSEESLTQAQKIAQIGSWEMDVITKKLVWSKQMYIILEVRTDEEPTFELYYSRVHPDDLAYVQEVGAQVYTKNEAARAEYRLLLPSGITKYIATEGRQFLDKENNVIKLTGIVQDITERKKVEEAVKKHTFELRTLSEQLINAQEDERKRISQELHDEMGQALTMMKLNLESIKDSFAPDQFSIIKNKWKEMDSLTENMLERTHQMTLDLRPHMLDDLGLVSTLRWYKDTFVKKLNIDVQFKAVNLEERLTPELEITLYRIVQEAFTNIAKHAQAKNVLLNIKRLKSSIKLKIKDDGIGFNLEEVEKRRKKEHGMGLLGMRERASLFKGTCTVESVPGEGTRIEVKIPLR